MLGTLLRKFIITRAFCSNFSYHLNFSCFIFLLLSRQFTWLFQKKRKLGIIIFSYFLIVYNFKNDQGILPFYSLDLQLFFLCLPLCAKLLSNADINVTYPAVIFNDCWTMIISFVYYRWEIVLTGRS